MRLEIHVHNTEKLLLLFDLSRAFSALMELGERERTEDIPLFADRVIATAPSAAASAFVGSIARRWR
jgi:hypothetical protein